MNNLIDALIKKQNTEKLDNSKFTRKLGISRTLWVEIKSGDRPVTLSVLRGIVRTYPDLHLDVLNFLRDGGKNSDE